MLEAARDEAEAAGVHLDLRLGCIEDFPDAEIFDVVTIGRALHWLDPGASLEKLEQIVSERGHVLVCDAASIESPASPWLKPYKEICNLWSDDPARKRYRIKAGDWFAGSPFIELGNISIKYSQRVSIADLIGRALSKSNTSLSILGTRQTEFEAAIRGVLQPFSRDGVVEEQIDARAVRFGRPA